MCALHKCIACIPPNRIPDTRRGLDLKVCVVLLALELPCLDFVAIQVSSVVSSFNCVQSSENTTPNANTQSFICA